MSLPSLPALTQVPQLFQESIQRHSWQCPPTPGCQFQNYTPTATYYPKQALPGLPAFNQQLHLTPHLGHRPGLYEGSFPNHLYTYFSSFMVILSCLREFLVGRLIYWDLMFETLYHMMPAWVMYIPLETFSRRISVISKGSLIYLCWPHLKRSHVSSGSLTLHGNHLSAPPSAGLETMDPLRERFLSYMVFNPLLHSWQRMGNQKKVYWIYEWTNIRASKINKNNYSFPYLNIIS